MSQLCYRRVFNHYTPINEIKYLHVVATISCYYWANTRDWLFARTTATKCRVASTFKLLLHIAHLPPSHEVGGSTLWKIANNTY